NFQQQVHAIGPDQCFSTPSDAFALLHQHALAEPGERGYVKELVLSRGGPREVAPAGSGRRWSLAHPPYCVNPAREAYPKARRDHRNSSRLERELIACHASTSSCPKWASRLPKAPFPSG